MPLIDDNGDVHLAADTRGDGIGSLIFSTGGVERGRIKSDGSGSGVFGAAIPASVGQNIEVSPSGVTRFIGTAPIRRLQALFAPLVCDLAVGLRPNGTDYELLYGWGGGRYWRCNIALESGNPGSFPLHQIQDQWEVTPLLSTNGSDASVSYGVGVTGPTVNAGAYGGKYWYGTAAAQTITFTTPASVTKVGVRFPSFTNGAAAIVSIDGDKTAANLLPTAQQMVDSGAYPNTILVANAGPCNPTDRILDTYAGISTLDNQVVLADSLAAAAHTVILIPVGTARSVGAGTRAYFSGYGYATATTQITDANVVGYASIGLLSPIQQSAWEYAFKTGGTFFGNVHGYDVEDSISVTIDGVATTLSTGVIVGATDVVEITRKSHLVNPANTAQTVANVTTVYHLDRDGVRVDNTFNWQASLTIQAAYVMAAVNGVAWEQSGHAAQAENTFNQGSILNYPLGPATFNGSGDVYTPNNGVKSEAAWVYGGGYGLLVWMPNIATWTNNWANTTVYTRIEDRGTGGLYLTKIYFPRITDPTGTEAVNPGSTWSSTALYLMGRFPGGAAPVIGAA